MSKDVTSEVQFGNNDDEHLPLTKCICGETFELWGFMIGVYKDDPDECPECGRKYYFSNSIVIYQIEEEVSAVPKQKP